jgi:hypothetical protein
VIRTARVCHSKDGYILEVRDIPAWAYALDAANDWIVAVACKATKGYLCPLCLSAKWEWTFRVGWGWDAEWEMRRHSLGGLLFKLGQRGGRFHLKRQREVYSRLLTFDEVCEHFPDCRLDYDDDGVDYVRGVMVS